MTKIDLVESVYRAHGGMSRREAAEVVDTILESMKGLLERNHRLQIKGFGVFQVVRRRARRGRNPQTGRPMTLPERQALVFRPSSHLLTKLNETGMGNVLPARR